MNIFGAVSFFLFLIVAIGLFVKTVIDVRKIIKSKINNVDYPKELKKFAIFGGSFALALTISIFSIYFWASISPLWWEILASIIFVLLFGVSSFALYVTFRLHYYANNIPLKIKKWLHTIMMSSLLVMIISLWYSFNGFARYIAYPIPNVLSFTSGFVNNTVVSVSGFSIAFYALCILFGAIFVYFLSDHRLYQQYGKHGTIESTFFVAFPSGIIGARIWYVIGNWTRDGFDKDPISMFYIWNGGLTILGGAITGIVVGVLWYMWRNKHYSIWIAVDMIVPTILLAQAIGRVGNFFNTEVHGNPVEIAAWQWLPMIITKNGQFSSSEASLAGTSQFYLPLFLIEGVLNVLGYFLIAYLFGRKLRKYTEPGDLAFGYVLVYGLIRSWLEPLRNTSYNMGENGYWSWIFSVLFILFGAIMIFVNHLVRFLLRKKKNIEPKFEGNKKANLIASFASIEGIGLTILVIGVILMASGKLNTSSLSYDSFNVGILLLVIGVSLILIGASQLLYLLENNNPNKENITNEQI